MIRKTCLKSSMPRSKKQCWHEGQHGGLLTPMPYGVKTGRCEVGERAALPQQGALPQCVYRQVLLYGGWGISPTGDSGCEGTSLTRR
jgi:hypothetical protein